MKKKILLWTVKIAAICLWVLTLFIPDIFEKIEDVKVVNYKEVKLEESTATFKTIEVEFSEDALWGHIYFQFFNAEDELLYGPVVLFESNYTKFAECEIEYERLDECVRYEIKSAHVKTVNERKVDIISMMLSVLMFVVMIAVIRIDYKEEVIDGKIVSVYSGLIYHRARIADEKVFEEKWFTVLKGREVLLKLNETTDIKVEFGLMNKIEIETIEKPKIEKAEEKKDEVVEENKPVKKKTTTQPKNGKKKVVSGATTKAKLTVKTTSKNSKNKK